MLNRVTLRLLIPALLMGLLTLASCKDDEQGQGAEEATAQTADSAAATPEQGGPRVKVNGGTLRQLSPAEVAELRRQREGRAGADTDTPSPREQRAKPDDPRRQQVRGGQQRQARQGNQQAPQRIRSWHGISLKNVDEPVFGAPPECRAMVTHPYRSSPGRTAGLQRGDIITAVDGVRTPTYQEVRRKFPSSQPPGTQHELTVVRGGQELTLTLTLEQRPADMDAYLDRAWQTGSWESFDVQSLTDGSRITDESLEGKVVVLDFWATWCGPCRRIMPQLDALQREFGDQGFVVVGISSEEEGALRGFMDAGRANVSYPLARDTDGSAKAAYEVRRLPTLYLIDREGRVVTRESGTGGPAAIRRHLPDLL